MILPWFIISYICMFRPLLGGYHSNLYLLKSSATISVVIIIISSLSVHTSSKWFVPKIMWQQVSSRCLTSFFIVFCFRWYCHLGGSNPSLDFVQFFFPMLLSIIQLEQQAKKKRHWDKKYTKLNIHIMIPSLINVYQAHAAQPNLHDMVAGFDKSIA